MTRPRTGDLRTWPGGGRPHQVRDSGPGEWFPRCRCSPASFRPGDAFTNGSRDRWVLAGYGGMCQKAAPGGAGVMEVERSVG